MNGVYFKLRIGNEDVEFVIEDDELTISDSESVRVKFRLPDPVFGEEIEGGPMINSEDLKRVIKELTWPYQAAEICSETNLQKWMFEGKEFPREKEEEHEAFTYAFIMKTDSPDEPSRYIGFKKFNSNWWDYLSSSKGPTDSVEKYMKENGAQCIARRILTLHDNASEARAQEEELLDLFSARKNPIFFNRMSKRIVQTED